MRSSGHQHDIEPRHHKQQADHGGHPRLAGAVTRRALVLLCLLAAPAAAQVPVRVACAGSPVALPGVDSAQLMSDLAALADDSMEGRKVGTAGGARARGFVQARFRAIGLDTLSTGMLERFPAPTGSPGKAANVVGLVPGGPGPGASSW